jgi:hypothetical protein
MPTWFFFFLAQLKVRLFEKQEPQSSSPEQSVKKELFSTVFHPSNAGPLEITASLAPQSQAVVVEGKEFLSSDNAVSRFRSESNSPEFAGAYFRSSDPLLELIFSGWNPDLPDPPILEH